MFRPNPKSSKKVEANLNSREAVVQRGNEAQKESEFILKKAAGKVH